MLVSLILPIRSRVSKIFCFFLVVTLFGCVRSPVVLPRGAGVPLTDFQDVFTTATGPCRQVRTMELMLAISGRAGNAKLRGRVRGALARPSSLRLEGLAPFGAPAFIFVARPDVAVLLLPRERRVVSDATADDLLGTLAGVPLGPADFHAVLTGCLTPDPQAHEARKYGNGWIGVDLDGGGTLYIGILNGVPVVKAGERDGLVVEYLDHARGLPRRVRVRSSDNRGSSTDVIAVLSQVSINTQLHTEVFVAHLSGDYAPMTLHEFRGGPGPLEESERLDR